MMCQFAIGKGRRPYACCGADLSSLFDPDRVAAGAVLPGLVLVSFALASGIRRLLELVAPAEAGLLMLGWLLSWMWVIGAWGVAFVAAALGTGSGT